MNNKNRVFEVREPSPLLDFLLERLCNKSRNHVKSLLTRGQVTVGGIKTKQFDAPLKPGQIVEIHINPSEKTARNAVPLPFPIIYEDKEIIVIDKPAGMLSISTDMEKEQTAYHFLMDYTRGKNSRSRIYVVHRLDRETSGILLFAKNEKLKLALQENWSELAVHRGYMAVVEGRVDNVNGVIKSWLKQTKTLLVYSVAERSAELAKENGAKEAITHYETIRAGEKYSLLSLSLKTGRKNQIRVHMKDFGHPVVGDAKYGASSKAANPLKRLGLHAHLLVVRHPYTDKEMRFESETPRTFVDIVLRKYS